MKILFSALAVLLSLFGSSAQASTKWLTPDFLLVTRQAPLGAANPFATFGSDADCRAAIAKEVCLVDPPGSGTVEPRACLPGSESYAAPFEKLYDQLPAHLQQMFCHLSQIYVEKEFIGSAYAGVVKEGNQENGRIVSGVIGIRKSLLDHPYSFDDWASWKEQLHFGVDPKVVNFQPGLPIVHTNMAKNPSGMLYFLVTHEFGHIFDFTNELNEGGSWLALSWKEAEVPLDSFEFPLRKRLCFYFCEGNFLPADRQNGLYSSLAKTNFISAYTTRYAAEDFADTLAYYTLLKERNLSYQVVTGSGQIYDAAARMRSDPLLESKRQYLERFLHSAYRYPGTP